MYSPFWMLLSIICFEVKLGALLGSRGSLGSLGPLFFFSDPARCERSSADNTGARRARETNEGHRRPLERIRKILRMMRTGAASLLRHLLLFLHVPFLCCSVLIFSSSRVPDAARRPLRSRRPHCARFAVEFLNYFLAVIHIVLHATR